MSKRIIILTFVLAVLFSGTSSVLAFYPFGGLITSLLPPAPAGPCSLPSIVVGPPNPGIFMIPPGTLFPFFNLTMGHFVLGLASLPKCGSIYVVGTSL